MSERGIVRLVQHDVKLLIAIFSELALYYLFSIFSDKMTSTFGTK